MPPRQVKRKDAGLVYWIGGSGLSEPDCTVYIGATAIEWQSAVELMAPWYAGLILGVRPPEDKSRATLIEGFNAIRSFSLKRKLLLDAAKSRFTLALVGDFEKHLSELQDAQKSRDKIVHGSWLLSPVFQNALVLDPLVGPFYEIYDPVALAEIHDKVKDAAMELLVFYTEKIEPLLKT